MMNALEKVHLIKELHKLGHDLTHRSLSLYEIARSKKRLHEIFLQCGNEPIFKKQLLAFKSRIQPEETANEFAQQSHYYHSYRGFFLNKPELEQALYAHPHSGWAFLHDPKRGWQIWLIPAPHRTALISEWTDIEQSFHWLLHQQTLSSCLKSDHELQASAATLSLELVEGERPTLAVDTYISKRQIWSDSIPAPVADATETELPDTPPEKTETVLPEVGDLQEQAQEIATSQIPETLQLQDLTLQVSAFNFPLAREHFLFQLDLLHEPAEQHVYMAWHYQTQADWTTLPVYLAEQVDQQGRFIRYCMLLGAGEQSYAIQLMQLWGQQDGLRIVAIKAISLQQLGTRFLQLNTLYEAYAEQARSVWEQEYYCPFIPLSLITTKKFILFEEQEANFNTPVLLLQERQKLRVIHGAKRFKLASDEHMYPCLILKRDQQINWQMIHQIILEAEEPIAVQDLYDAILSKALEKLM